MEHATRILQLEYAHMNVYIYIHTHGMFCSYVTNHGKPKNSHNSQYRLMKFGMPCCRITPQTFASWVVHYWVDHIMFHCIWYSIRFTPLLCTLYSLFKWLGLNKSCVSLVEFVMGSIFQHVSNQDMTSVDISFYSTSFVYLCLLIKRKTKYVTGLGNLI